VSHVTENYSVPAGGELRLPRFSLGVGDRFAHQAAAQLRACELALEAGIAVTPVWNKSNREHQIVGSEPGSVRAAAEAAVAERHWQGGFHVDADHITLQTVEGFLDSSDFFTLDVADFIGGEVAPGRVESFASAHPELLSAVELPGGAGVLQLDAATIALYATRYLPAVDAAAAIYRRIVETKGAGNFITEVSMDETEAPQTPGELLVILAALADAAIPVQTIAPKFSGRFNKGVDYVGDLAQFEREFRSDLAVLAHAVKIYGLPSELKLSIHSGSDKFSIYPAMRKALQESGAGLHLKTAGTTWLEELIGLADSGDEALAVAKEIYTRAHARRLELCRPYATVIDIDETQLPTPDEAGAWSSQQFVAALRHDTQNPAYNRHLRQLLHVGYKIAAEMGETYREALRANRATIARNVTENLFERHIKAVFPAGGGQ
jgi:hypothetical protein